MSLRPEQAAAQLLANIRETESRLAAGDSDQIPFYNYQVARLMEEISEAGLGSWSEAPRVTGPGGSFAISWSDPRAVLAPDRKLVTTDSIRFSGRDAGPPALRQGIGAPIIVEASEKMDLRHFNPEADHFTQRYQSATAVVRVDGQKAVIELLDPYSQDSVYLAGENRPLAADFSSSVSLSVARDRIDKLGFARMVNPQRYDATAELFTIQPYDPDRIPVLLVHGLQDTAATWLPLYRELMRDPVIRENYQFWLFSYPSGYPYPYSASLLRKQLELIRNEHPDHQDVVIVGHSMGGVISRLVLLDPGDSIWKVYFGTPLSETPVKGQTRKLLEDALVFEPLPHVSRAVFFSAPHRGSDLAVDWIGRFGSRLIRPPSLIADVRDSVVNLITEDDAALQLNHAANSIDTLAPDDRFVLATKDLPISRGFPYHSVMGNRGKSGPKEKSSDGVVAYWSSHVDKARSERLVPSGHGSHRHPEGIAELHRILLLHLEQ